METKYGRLHLVERKGSQDSTHGLGHPSCHAAWQIFMMTYSYDMPLANRAHIGVNICPMLGMVFKNKYH